MDKEVLFKNLSAAVVGMDESAAVEISENSIKEGIAPYETIQHGLIDGMKKVSHLYEEEEYFLPEVLMCSDAMTAGLGVLSPYLDTTQMETPIKIVMGVVEGDTHDIGKNLVRIMTEAGGMQVHDLGRDVPLDNFIQKAEEIHADVIAMSTLMTTTMDGMKTVIDKLSDLNIREKYKVFIGGGPISQRFANEIGADFYTKDASEATRVIKKAFGKE